MFNTSIATMPQCLKGKMCFTSAEWLDKAFFNIKLLKKINGKSTRSKFRPT